VSLDDFVVKRMCCRENLPWFFNKSSGLSMLSWN